MKLNTYLVHMLTYIMRLKLSLHLYYILLCNEFLILIDYLEYHLHCISLVPMTMKNQWHLWVFSTQIKAYAQIQVLTPLCHGSIGNAPVMLTWGWGDFTYLLFIFLVFLGVSTRRSNVIYGYSAPRSKLKTRPKYWHHYAMAA